MRYSNKSNNFMPYIVCTRCPTRDLTTMWEHWSNFFLFYDGVPKGHLRSANWSLKVHTNGGLLFDRRQCQALTTGIHVKGGFMWRKEGRGWRNRRITGIVFGCESWGGWKRVASWDTPIVESHETSATARCSDDDWLQRGCGGFGWDGLNGRRNWRRISRGTPHVVLNHLQDIDSSSEHV